MAMTDTDYEAMEGLESENEAAERARFRRPSSAPSFRPRPAPSAPVYVTQPQLEAALARVDGKIKTVTDSSAAVSARVVSLQASLKKESEERKKGLDSQTKELNQKVQLLALLPLLVKQSTATLRNPLLDSAGNPTISAVSVPSTNSLDTLLPLLLVSGLGGSGGGFSLGGDSSGSDNSLILLALVLASANK